MANEESRDFSGSQQIDQATDQGTVAITGATESTNGINANVQLRAGTIFERASR